MAEDMEVATETEAQKWERVLKPHLPNGFFIEFRKDPNPNRTIRLRYNGPGFQKLLTEDQKGKDFSPVESINSINREDNTIIEDVGNAVRKIQERLKALKK